MSERADTPISGDSSGNAVPSKPPLALLAPRTVIRLYRPGLVVSFLGLLIFGYVFLVWLAVVQRGNWFMLFGLWEVFVCWNVCFRAFVESLARLTLYANGFSAASGCRSVRRRWADITVVWMFPRFRFAERDGIYVALCGRLGVLLFDMSNAEASLALPRITEACEIQPAFTAGALGVSVYSRHASPDVQQALLASRGIIKRAIYRQAFSVFVLCVPALCGAIWYASQCGEPATVVLATIATLYTLWRGIDWCRLYNGINAMDLQFAAVRGEADEPRASTSH